MKNLFEYVIAEQVYNQCNIKLRTLQHRNLKFHVICTTIREKGLIHHVYNVRYNYVIRC